MIKQHQKLHLQKLKAKVKGITKLAVGILFAIAGVIFSIREGY